MPISPETASQLPGGSPPERPRGNQVDDKDILLRPEDTRLELLADRFLLPDMARLPGGLQPRRHVRRRRRVLAAGPPADVLNLNRSENA